MVPTPDSRLISSKLGLFSGFLLELKNSIVQQRKSGVTLACRLHPSVFKLPAKINTPIVCFANGAGIGIIRSLIQEKLHAIANEIGDHPIGPISVFFGTRTSSDMLIKGDLETATRAKVVKELKVALSREEVLPVFNTTDGLGRKEDLRVGLDLR